MARRLEMGQIRTLPLGSFGVNPIGRRPLWGSPAAVRTAPLESVANNANRGPHGTAVTGAPGTPTKLSDTGAQAPIRPLCGSPPAVHTAPSELVANNANLGTHGTAVTGGAAQLT